MLIDTHCHIHESNYPLDAADTLQRARTTGVEKLICVGTDEKSSMEALKFSASHDNIFASIGVHPHEAKGGYGQIAEYFHHGDGFAPGSTRAPASGRTRAADVAIIESPQPSRLVAVGEIGLDYFYTHSPREVQIAALEAQIQLALDHGLPIIFHVRDGSSAKQRTSVWSDFWPIIDNFRGIRGELHSFTDSMANMEAGLARGLYIGVNGISTFTKDSVQRETFAALPLDRMLLETDAPFLTPVPFRGKVNEPAFVRNVAEYHAQSRGISIEEIATITTANAHALFAL